MNDRRLGKTGLQISPLCLGTMTFGDGADEATSGEIYKLARDGGINLFDCANVYAEGDSERILGHIVKGHRHEVILTTKAYYPMSEAPNDRGLSRRHLTLALHDSLKRLGTDYIDIYFLHCFDPNVPLEESLATVNDFVRQGKILYVGISNFAAWQVMKAIGIADGLNGLGIHCLQPMYNLLRRQAETELLPMAADQDLGVLAYGPLAGGLLTGKYQSGTPSGARLTYSEMYQQRYEEDRKGKAISRFCSIARNHDLDPAALAIAWAASHPSVTAPLIGARTPDQMKRGLAALDIDMTDALYDEVTACAPAPALATDRTEETL